MLAENLRNLRKSKGISQKTLAEALGVSQSTVAMWESGKNSPEHGTFLKLCDYLSVSGDALVAPPSRKTAVKVPVLGYVKAGLPGAALEEVLDYETVYLTNEAASEYFALKVKGDSMSPRMLDGDVVIVRRCAEFQSGDICVVLVGGDDATVKKVIKKEQGIILVPLNPNYDPMFFSQSDILTCPVAVIGKVTELRAKI